MKQNKALINNGPIGSSKVIPRYSDKYKDVLERAYKREQLLKQKQKPIFFYRVRSIGVGAFSFVYLVSQQNSGSLFAQKSINKKSIAPELQTEIKMHLALSHQNIVNLYHIYSQDNYVNLIMDYAGESLFVLRKNYKLPLIMAEQQIISILKQLISAVKYLHSRRIVHADIKLQNILYFQGVVKLCDLGYAHIAKQEQHEYTHYSQNGEHKQNNDAKQHSLSQIVGTLEYLDPEYVRGKHSQYSRDIWAIGIVGYEMLVGKNPFQDMQQNQKWSSIIKMKQIDVKQFNLSKQMQQLLSMMLCPIAKRANITEISNLPMFHRNQDLLKKQWLQNSQGQLFH